MSLLLDALKKAAADKHKNTQSLTDSDTSADLNSIDDSVENRLNNMSMDLELHPDALNTNNDDYPTVNQSVNKINKKKHHNDKPSALSKKDIKNEKKQSIPENEDKKANPKIEIINNESVPEHDLDIDKEKKLSGETQKHTLSENEKKEDSIEYIDESISEKTQTALTNSQPQEEQISISRDKLTDEALTELINKSNKHTQRETIKKRFFAGITLFLILSASIFYFYNQFKISNESIYITDTLTSSPEFLSITQKETSDNIEPIKKGIIKKPTNQLKSSSTKFKQENKLAIKKPTVKSAIKKPNKRPINNNPNPINFIKTNKINPINQLLRDAYTSFQKNNYSNANTLYNKVLNIDNKNRDALLGLAAIGIKNNHYEFSRQKYLFLLKLNPRDSLAIAGLSSLNNQENPRLSESKLKFLLKQQPDAGHLYFALGTLYSSKQKWAEAQSAYYSAWSSNNKNADYAYNLAVSLDHLDKTSQALDFYTLSLKLRSTSNGNFSIAETKKRILTLLSNEK